MPPNPENKNEFNYGGYSKEKVLKRDTSGNKENYDLDNSNNNNLNSMIKAAKINKKELDNNNMDTNQNTQNNMNGINVNNTNSNEENLISNNFSFVPLKKKYVKKFAYKSQPGKNDNGLSKINQDNFLIMENILNNEEFRIFGVFDGHGNHHLFNYRDSWAFG